MYIQIKCRAGKIETMMTNISLCFHDPSNNLSKLCSGSTSHYLVFYIAGVNASERYVPKSHMFRFCKGIGRVLYSLKQLETDQKAFGLPQSAESNVLFSDLLFIFIYSFAKL